MVSSFFALLLAKAIIQDSFIYYSWYIICFWIMYSFFYFNRLSKKLLHNVFALIALILSISGFIQFFSGYNFIVGTFDNPAGYSLSLVLLFPFALHLCRCYPHNKLRWIYGGICITVAIAICLSESRTAIIAIALIFACLTPSKYKYVTWGVLISLVLVLLCAFKNDSTTGRFFILKTACSMINSDSSLIWGYGFGDFKNQYMSFQAKAFEDSCNDKYVMFADNIYHPLNEYALFFIEQGILFSILGLAILLVYLYKTRENAPQKLCFITILTFSFFSYPFKYPITLLMLAYVLSFLKMRRTITIPIYAPMRLGICILSLMWIVHIAFDIRNNYIWNKLYNKVQLGQFYKVKDTYEDLYKDMRKNANFIFNYATVLFRNGSYSESLSYAQKCLSLINNYDIQLLLADNYYKLGKYEFATQHYKEASHMCPNRFSPLYGIFIIYNTTNNINQAIDYGHTILNKPIKIKSTLLYDILLDVQEKMDSLKLKNSK